MELKELLKSPLINTSAIAVEMWPEKPKQNAKVLLRNKVYEINGNRLTEEDQRKIREILNRVLKSFFV